MYKSKTNPNTIFSKFDLAFQKYQEEHNGFMWSQYILLNMHPPVFCIFSIIMEAPDINSMGYAALTAPPEFDCKNI